MRKSLLLAACVLTAGCASPSGGPKSASSPSKPPRSQAARYNLLTGKQVAARTQTHVEGEATR